MGDAVTTSIHNMEWINQAAKCNRFLEKRLLKTEHMLNGKCERFMSVFPYADPYNMSADCKTTDYLETQLKYAY